MSSKELGKCEYFTGEDLGYKLGVVDQAKLEYSSLGKIFNKRLGEGDKKDGVLQRLKNVESKNEEQLTVIKDQAKNNWK